MSIRFGAKHLSLFECLVNTSTLTIRREVKHLKLILGACREVWTCPNKIDLYKIQVKLFVKFKIGDVRHTKTVLHIRYYLKDGYWVIIKTG